MNNLITDVKSLEIETLKNLKNSKANNTLRAYKSDFKDFGAFCAKNGLNSLPTEPKIVSLYLTHLSKNSKISTLRRRLVSISMVHKMKGHYLDTKHPIIVENLMGIRRVKGSIQRGKKPILINHLKLLIDTAKKNKIDHQLMAASRFTGTDTDAFAYSNDGVASALISLPLKYMHTTVETAHKDDIENCIKLMYESILAIKKDQDFRYIK